MFSGGIEKQYRTVIGSEEDGQMPQEVLYEKSCS